VKRKEASSELLLLLEKEQWKLVKNWAVRRKNDLLTQLVSSIELSRSAWLVFIYKYMYVRTA